MEKSRYQILITENREAQIEHLLSLIADGEQAMAASKRVAATEPSDAASMGFESMEQSVAELRKELSALLVDSENLSSTVALCKCGAVKVVSLNCVPSAELMDEFVDAAQHGATIKTMGAETVRSLPTECSCLQSN